MPQLHIAFHEGLTNDSAVVSIDGREVYRRNGLTTRLQIGLADSFVHELPRGTALVTVDVPSLSRSDSIRVELDADAYLAISISPEGEIRHQLSSQPFRYA